MTYCQLTYEQRVEIKAYLNCGLNQNSIAQKIGVHKSTISNELKRNSGLKGYRPKQAQMMADSRRKDAKKHVRFTEPVKQRVEIYLTQDWSPEQISGRLKLQEAISISHETIYQHIWADKQAGGILYTHLRCSHKKRKKRYGKKDHRGQIPHRISIDERPEIVDQKKRVGDWEIDTIIGKNYQGALVSAIERKSRFSCIMHVDQKTAELVTDALIQKLSPIKNKVFTMTADNGKEFASHQQIADGLTTQFFFAHPYCSWERGLNENTNGLIRQYFPKNHDFKSITEKDVQLAENLLNNRPRKSLKFKTPTEIFFNSSVALET
jgi:IS30 family transposase